MSLCNSCTNGWTAWNFQVSSLWLTCYTVRISSEFTRLGTYPDFQRKVVFIPFVLGNIFFVFPV